MQDFRPARGVMGVYVIVHAASGMAYIGSSVNIGTRWTHHRCCLRRQGHPNKPLQQAWDGHGEDAFVFTIVERVTSIDQLLPREKAWLTQGRTWVRGVGYNLTAGARGAGNFRTPEQRARQSAAMKGKPKTAEHRAKLWANREVTPEMRERMAEMGRMGKGRRKNAAWRRKIGAAQRGSANHAAKLNEAQVVEIMWRLANGERGRDIAALYGVNEPYISAIKWGKKWRHLTADWASF